MSRAHHLRLSAEDLAGNDGLGRYVLLPGDPGRAERLAQSFDRARSIEGARGFVAHQGAIRQDDGLEVDVLALATGAGSGSTEVVVHELIACGARRLLRVGSCGTGAATISPGEVVIVTGAVRDERTSEHYAPPEFPALAHPRAVAALCLGARAAGLAEHAFLGVCHSKASLYAREFGHGPAGAANLDYDAWLRRCGVIASEMEASTLLVMAAAHSGPPAPLACRRPADEIQAGAVLAVYGRDDSNMELDEEAVQLAEERILRLAIAAVLEWATLDREQPGERVD